jgi:hypothetical protein
MAHALSPLCSSFLLVASSFLCAAAHPACVGTTELHEATSASISTFVQRTGLKVLTFTGYSGAGYENVQTMREHASRILAANSPSRVLINIGATAEGIGEVYEVAKGRGFTTIGIVSSLARDERVPISACVDHVFFVKDKTWGGSLPGSNKLSPTSQAIVDNSSSLVGIGGGDVARDEMLAAQSRGKPVTFIPADMNHHVARARAEKRNQPVPQDFRGPAHSAFRTGI